MVGNGLQLATCNNGTDVINSCVSNQWRPTLSCYSRIRRQNNFYFATYVLWGNILIKKNSISRFWKICLIFSPHE
jgi:hypothetical protein